MQISRKYINNYFNTHFSKDILDVAKACFGSYDPAPEKQREVERWFKEVDNKVKEEQIKAKNTPLFEYIQSQKGMNASQYQTFWVNYLFRTWYTVSGVLKLAEKAYYLGDVDATLYGANNLEDELAIGKKNLPHPKLLLQTNKFGNAIYGLQDSTILTAKKSKFLLPEALTDRRVRESLYKSDNPIEVFGANWIHEALAGQMLEDIFNSVYKPYEKTYNMIIQLKDAFNKDIFPYFDVHLDGNVEYEHMCIARALVRRYLAMSDNISLTAKELDSAVTAFSRSQNFLWDAIQKDMEARSKEGAIIPKDVISNTGSLDIKNLSREKELHNVNNRHQENIQSALNRIKVDKGTQDSKILKH